MNRHDYFRSDIIEICCKFYFVEEFLYTALADFATTPVTDPEQTLCKNLGVQSNFRLGPDHPRPFRSGCGHGLDRERRSGDQIARLITFQNAAFVSSLFAG